MNRYVRSFRFVPRAFLATALGLTLVAAGCGSDTKQASAMLRTVPVKGSVVYAGKPLTGGTIRFEPVDSGREATGNIGPDGTFTLTTFQAEDGAVAGLHRVAIEPPAGKTKSVPVKFRNPASSGIELEVSADRTEYLVELK